MPEISRFLGIVIAMYYSDHDPAHFHAQYGEYEIKVRIADGAIEGAFPSRATRLVLEWLSVHRDALRANWERARQRVPLLPVPPLE